LVAVHKSIPIRKMRLAKPWFELSLYKNKLSKKSINAINDEKKNSPIKGDFKMTRFIEFMARIASEELIFLNDCITKKENAKYTPPINPKLIIAISSIHESKEIILKFILESNKQKTPIM